MANDQLVILINTKKKEQSAMINVDLPKSLEQKVRPSDKTLVVAIYIHVSSFLGQAICSLRAGIKFTPSPTILLNLS